MIILTSLVCSIAVASFLLPQVPQVYSLMAILGSCILLLICSSSKAKVGLLIGILSIIFLLAIYYYDYFIVGFKCKTQDAYFYSITLLIMGTTPFQVIKRR